MSRIVDNLIAYRVLTMLVKPFDQTDAYKLGIIDEKGKILKRANTLRNQEEKEAYTYLHRLVFNVKRLINKLPGGESKLKNIVAALFLIKECYEKNDTTALLEEKLTAILDEMESKDITLVDEELMVEEFLSLTEDVANVTGSGVSTDTPAARLKSGRRYAAFVVNDDIFRRFKKGKRKFSKWSDYLNLEDEGEKLIYDYARKHPKGVLVLKNGKEEKAIRFNRNGGGKWSKLTRKKSEVLEAEVV